MNFSEYQRSVHQFADYPSAIVNGNEVKLVYPVFGLVEEIGEAREKLRAVEDIDNLLNIAAFMKENDYVKCDSDYARWQGIYQNSSYAPRIIISSKPGVGDVVIDLNDGKKLFIESKKFKSGSGGEYPAMREAIGQLMTGCPDDPNIVPVVAVSLSAKSAELAQTWSSNERIRKAGIHFMLVSNNGSIGFK